MAAGRAQASKADHLPTAPLGALWLQWEQHIGARSCCDCRGGSVRLRLHGCDWGGVTAIAWVRRGRCDCDYMGATGEVRLRLHGCDWGGAIAITWWGNRNEGCDVRRGWCKCAYFVGVITLRCVMCDWGGATATAWVRLGRCDCDYMGATGEVRLQLHGCDWGGAIAITRVRLGRCDCEYMVW